MKSQRTHLFTGVTIALFLGNSIFGSEPISFARDVAPILTSKCYQCHGPDDDAREADLRFDQLDRVIAKSEAESVINPGDATKSILIQRVETDDPDARMPPVDHAGPLSPKEVAVLRRWVNEGAAHARHWSFVPPKRPALPDVDKKDWVRSPIDRFVLAKLEENGLPPSSEADRYTLLRRLSIDLTGLPPSIEQIHDFVEGSSVSLWDQAVDELLASPRFGERMAQDWLDAARYADTTGHAADKPRTMWLFRDWVIDALNENMPFDQFTIEQLAGDMLPNASESQLIATGFHRNSMQALGNNPRKEEFRVKGIVDRLDTTGRVWLGVTVGCAECHDHKFDPLSQKEYYELFAIFNNVPHLGEKFEVHGPRTQVLPKTVRMKIRSLRNALHLATDPNEQNRFTTQIAELGKQTVTAQTMSERSTARPTFIHVRGNFENPGDKVRPSIPAIARPAEYGEPNTLTRLEFARALVNRKHPLTARVAVNRIWQHYFGAGFVTTSDDFGVRGELPSHPKLLDWLAVEFMESGWNVKHIHRLIVTSSTYRQSSASDAKLKQTDPDNRLLARATRKRMAAEQIRDLGVLATGNFSGTIGGPSVFPIQDPSIGQFRDDTAGKWVNDQGSGQYRRAIYTFWQRMSPYPSSVMFDAPSREQCSVQRPSTNTPLQALTTLNDPYFVRLAREFGRRVVLSKETFDGRLDFAFMTVLSRPPNEFERRSFAEFAARIKTDDGRWFQIAQVLLNLDETITRE